LRTQDSSNHDFWYVPIVRKSRAWGGITTWSKVISCEESKSFFVDNNGRSKCPIWRPKLQPQMTLHSQVNTSNKRMKKGQATKNPRNVEEVRGKRRDQKTYMFLGLNIRGKLLLQYPL